MEIRALFLLIILILMAAAPSTTTAAVEMAQGTSTARALLTTRDELRSSVRFDGSLFDVPSSSAASVIDLLITATQTGQSAVCEEGWHLLVAAVRQLPLTAADQDRIRTRIESAPASCVKGVPPNRRETALLSRVIWELHARQAAEQSVGVEYCEAQLSNWADGYYYPFRAVECLVQLGSPEARRVLNESLERGGDSRLLERLAIGLEQLALTERLTRMGPAERVQELLSALRVNQQDGSVARREFSLSLLRRLADLASQEAIAALSSLMANSADDEPLAFAAQEELVRIGALLPSQRTIHHLE